MEVNEARTHIEVIQMTDKEADRGRVVNLLSHFMV